MTRMTLPLLSRRLSRWMAGQAGAMFGMDARIALVIAAVLTAAGGVAYMSRIESSKVQAAEAQAEILRDALKIYYGQPGVNHLPDTLEEVFRTGAAIDPSMKRDPWGNPWEYSHIVATVKVEDTPISIQMAVIASRGKNGVADSSALTSEQDFNEWMPGKDDVGVKFTSRDVELARLQNYRARAQLIIDKLEAFESAGFLEAQNTCMGEAPADWCSKLEGKNYTLFNYYPKMDSDSTAGTIYYSDRVLNKHVYASGDLSDMQQLMVDLGLPADYAQDPWGRTLMVNTNVTARTDPPYSAAICFSSGENCLSRTGE